VPAIDRCAQEEASMTGSDPRPLQARAFAQARLVIAGVRPDEMTLPTPCTEFDVRTLIGHMITAIRRYGCAGRGGDPAQIPFVTTGISDYGWVSAFDHAVDEARSAWSDDSLLSRDITLPFATLPGALVVSIYSLELTVHAWDLAAAVGDLREFEPEIGQAMLAVARQIAPAEMRGAAIEHAFEAVVDVPDESGVYDRLAAWLGRDVPRWAGAPVPG
jgi:uncharacterized protein (TIGR03086 family)